VLFNCSKTPAIARRYNIAPSQEMPVIVQNASMIPAHVLARADK
jgi:putative SOS response-associated peptidase YedK